MPESELKRGEIYRGSDLKTFLATLPRPSEVLQYALEGNKLDNEQELVLASRTFSVPILAMRYLWGRDPESRRREKDKSKVVGAGYNWPRFGDTIEDSTAPLGLKVMLLEKYNEGLELLTRAEDTPNNFEKARGIFHDITEALCPYLVKAADEAQLSKGSEQVFMENFGSTLETFRTLSPNVKNSFFRYFVPMTKGMITYLKKSPETIDQLKDYNYHVAGLVGEFLTETVAEMDEFKLMPTKAIPFGDYLQWANNIRDVGDDYRYRNKRIIWPSEFFKDCGVEAFMTDPKLKSQRTNILESLLETAYESRDGTFDYILSMPPWLTGYAAFCTIPAILADKTYEAIENEESMEREDVFMKEGGVKIGKDEFKNVLQQIIGLADLDKDEGRGRIHAFIRNYREAPERFSFKDGEFEKWAGAYFAA